MKKFQFKLDTVLRLKNRKVDEETRKLSIVVGKINRLKNEVQDNRKAISYENEKFPSYVKDDIAYLRIFDNYIKTLYLQNENLQRQMNEEDDALRESVQSVVNAKKDAELIEVIKNKRLSEYHERILRFERSEEDEESQKEFAKDRRGLRSVLPDEQTKPVIPKHRKKIQSNKNTPKSDYEKVMEYYGNSSGKK